jgi:hypothetical protein
MRKLSLSALGAALVAAAVIVPLSTGSSHREAPNISLDPAADNTDVYAFVPKDAPDKVALIANWFPNSIPAGGPTFYRFDDRARYYINIDNTGDGRPDIRYLFRFDTDLRSPGSTLYSLPGVTSVNNDQLNVIQRYNVFRERLRRGRVVEKTRIGRQIPVAPSNLGPKTFPDYEALTRQATRRLSGGRRVFAGQRDDPFFVDLGATFDALNIRRGTGNEGAGKDDFSGLSTQSIVLQVPQTQLTRNGREVRSPRGRNAVIGVWSSTERRRLEVTNANFRSNRRSRGRFVQVSRLGNPLVNEVIIPMARRDQFNRTSPAGDARRFGRFVVRPELAAILNALFDVNAPERNRTDIVQALLTGIPNLTRISRGAPPTDTLKLNMGVPPTENPNRFGVLAGDNQGFPNGRRLIDDVVDIELQVVAGFLRGNRVPLGDGVDQNDKPFSDTFPYLAPPTSGLDSNPTNRVEPPHSPVPAGGGQ